MIIILIIIVIIILINNNNNDNNNTTNNNSNNNIIYIFKKGLTGMGELKQFFREKNLTARPQDVLYRPDLGCEMWRKSMDGAFPRKK